MQRIVKGDSYTIALAIKENGVVKDLTGVRGVTYTLKDQGHVFHEIKYPENPLITIPNPEDGKIFIKLTSEATSIPCSFQITQTAKLVDKEDQVVTVLHETLTSTLDPKETV